MFKGLRIAKTILEKKNKVGGLKLPDIKSCDRATVIKTMGQELLEWINRRESGNKPLYFQKLIFDEGADNSMSKE